MKTIKKPDSVISDIWGLAKPDSFEYRPIHYLTVRKVADGLLLGNIVTGELVLLNDEEEKKFNALPSAFDGWMAELIAGHFLVPVDYDEYVSIKSLRTIVKAVKNSKSDHTITGYTILPTTACNARCFYCFEAGCKKVSMTDESCKKTIDYILKNSGDNSVHIQWFGGEPTLGAKYIDKICRELNDAGKDFTSSMISNGYLFDEDMVGRAKKLWKLNDIQITLDGTEEVYNKVKSYVGVDGSPFLRVMRNIGLLLDAEITVTVRLNLDRHNDEDLFLLTKQLFDRFGTNEYLRVYSMPLFDDCGFDPVKRDDSDRTVLYKKHDELEAHIESFKPRLLYGGRLPVLRTNCCCADNESCITILPDGNLCRCIENFHSPVGHLDTGFDKSEYDAWYKTVDSPKCRECAIFPSCVRIERCSVGSKCDEHNRQNRYDRFCELDEAVYEKYKSNSK